MLSAAMASCINMNDPARQVQYLNAYQTFDKEMVAHIPAKLLNETFTYSMSSPAGAGKHSHAGMRVQVKHWRKSKYQKEKERYQEDAQFIGITNDQSWIVIQTDNVENIQDLIDEGRIPIPKSALYEDGYNGSKHSFEKADVFVLEYGEGDDLKEKFPEDETIPNGKKYSFSRGCTFDDEKQVIIYWLIYW
jgi:hypothetical protein